MVEDNPYIDKSNTRTFSKDVDEMSLIWHTDQEDRKVTVLEEDYDPDQEQLDDEDEIFMPMDDEGRPLEEKKKAKPKKKDPPIGKPNDRDWIIIFF